MGERIGLIAGSGIFPMRFAESAKRRGYRVVAAAHRGESDAVLEEHCDELTWVHVGQVGKIIGAFRKAGVAQAVMAGGIQKVKIFGGLRLDLKGLKLATRVKSFRNDDLLRAIAGLFEEEGVRIVDPSTFCPELLVQEEVYTRRKPSEEILADIRMGLEVSRALGHVDVGQTVCVKNGAVVAVEAMEGTDRCIRRAFEVAGKGVVVVKASSPKQDLRFDAPCIGPGTIATVAEAKGAALAVEAGRALILDREEVVAAAEKAGMVLLGVR